MIHKPLPFPTPDKTPTVRSVKNSRIAQTKILHPLPTSIKEKPSSRISLLATLTAKIWRSWENTNPSNWKIVSSKLKINNSKPKLTNSTTKSLMLKNSSSKSLLLSKNRFFSFKSKRTTNFNCFKLRTKKISQNSGANTNFKSMNFKNN